MARLMLSTGRAFGVALATGLLLAGCGGTKTEMTQAGSTTSSTSTVAPEGQRRAFTTVGAATPGRIEVNGFLWRGALDALSFMPLQSADAYGGAIISDWYSPPETPNERFKVNALVQGAELRADGVKVTMFRQTRESATGPWKDAEVDKNTPIDLENVILARARELRQQRLAGQ
ncbi:MAG: DUF3576 domain-containing protein [Candidatus Eiseniibacteriota bacterium]